jgi:hypothetical protein
LVDLTSFFVNPFDRYRDRFGQDRLSLVGLTGSARALPRAARASARFPRAPAHAARVAAGTMAGV